jgi:hypothetical protein
VTAAEAGGGAVPGVTRQEAEEVLRWVGVATHVCFCCAICLEIVATVAEVGGCCTWCDQARGRRSDEVGGAGDMSASAASNDIL